MECILKPKTLARPIARVLYVSETQYDSGEWFSYPARVGISHLGNNLDLSQYILYESTRPTATKKQESFFQTWLFFGLISEALEGNTPDLRTSLSNHGRDVIDSIYKKYLTTENGITYITTATLQSDLEESWSLLPDTNREHLLERCKRLRLCLWKALEFFKSVALDFEPTIKHSIAAVGEIISNYVMTKSRVLDLHQSCPRYWMRDFYWTKTSNLTKLSDVGLAMSSLGWCPSDLVRCKDKFGSFQMLYYISLLDRSKSNYVHTKCDSFHCEAYTTNPDTYKVRHVREGCSCKLVGVDQSRVEQALSKPGCVPLLRFIGDEKHMTVEIVESSNDTPFVAISHVWADGLGNQKANQLRSCQLVRLRTIVQALDTRTLEEALEGVTIAESPANLEASPTSNPLIWIDTLCCPVDPPKMKRLAIMKLRHVYEHAASVLVLDASLQAYESRSMDLTEKLARVATSGWLRRLWTLQEGALAKVLYFQFADEAITLTSLQEQNLQASKDAIHLSISLDFFDVYKEIQQYFNGRWGNGPTLNVLSGSLLHRGLSVASDEGLCIGTLMSLPIEQIVEASGNERMKVVWSLLADKMGGIPSEIIFMDEQDERLDIPGWRWAPATLLRMKPQQGPAEMRLLNWSDTKLGTPTADGLQVQYPGFRIEAREFCDGKPRQPWKIQHNLTIPEPHMIFRDLRSKQWYHVGVKMSMPRTNENRVAYDAAHTFPFRDLVKKGGCVILTQNPTYSRAPVHTPATSIRPVVGIAATLSPAQTTPASEQPSRDNPLPTVRDTRLTIRPTKLVLLYPVPPVLNECYDTAQVCALQLRSEAVTDDLLAISDPSSYAWNHALGQLLQRIREMVTGIMDGDATLAPRLKMVTGSDAAGLLLSYILDWFNHDFVGTRLQDDQIWLVD